MPLTALWSNFNEKPNEVLELPEFTNDPAEHKPGGSGGVYVLTAVDGKKFTIKTSIHINGLKDEVFADAGYKLLGFNVPACAAYQAKYNALPPEIQACISKPANESTEVFFRLAEYIEPDEKLLEDDRQKIIQETLADGFTTDCFFANHDIAGHWNNVLIDKQRKLWRIDNGSTLGHHARGHTKELHTVISELSSMKTKTAVMRAVFGEITTKTIQEQADRLLQKRDSLVELFLEIHKKIIFSEPSALLECLINRLNYLSEHVCTKLHPVASTLTVAHVNYTSAWVFFFDTSHGETHVLLCKPHGHDGWRPLGGESDARDLFLSDTATRTTNMSLSQCELTGAPSHDLMSNPTNSNPASKLRMYFCPADPNFSLADNPKNQTNPQPQEIQWFLLKELLEGRVPVDPLFNKMLKQHPVQAKLELLNTKTKILPPLHTQSRDSEEYPATLTKETCRSMTTPKLTRHGIASTLLIKTALHREFNSRDNPPQEETSANIEPQSNILFNALGITGTSAERVEKFIESYRRINPTQKITTEQNQQFIEMLEEEKRHPNHTVFYHATQADIAFLYRVFSEFRSQLEGSTVEVLRPFDNLFKKYPDISTFIEVFKDATGNISNYHPDYQEVCLSVNPFLFGCDGQPTSATYWLFLNGSSQKPPNVEKLFTYFANRLGIESDFKSFQEIFEQGRKERDGVCYQIFVPNAEVDNLTYPAASGGSLYPLETSKTSSQILSQLKANPEVFKCYITTVQFRLLLTPPVLLSKEVNIKTYFANPLSLNNEGFKKSEEAIKRTVHEILARMLAAGKKPPPNIFNGGTPRTVKTMGYVLAGTCEVLPDFIDMGEQIRTLITEKNITALIEIFTNITLDLINTPSAPLRNYSDYTRMKPTPNMLGFLFDNADCASKLLTALQSCKHKTPHLTKNMVELEWAVHMANLSKQGPENFVIFLTQTPDINFSKLLIYGFVENHPIYYPLIDDCYRRTELTEKFCTLLESHKDKSHITEILKKLRLISIRILIEELASLEDRLATNNHFTILIDPQELSTIIDSKKKLLMSTLMEPGIDLKETVLDGYSRHAERPPLARLLDDLNNQPSIAQIVFDALKPCSDQPQAAKILQQLNLVFIFHETLKQKNIDYFLTVIDETPHLNLEEKFQMISPDNKIVLFSLIDVLRVTGQTEALLSKLERAYSTKNKPNHIEDALFILRSIVSPNSQKTINPGPRP